MSQKVSKDTQKSKEGIKMSQKKVSKDTKMSQKKVSKDTNRASKGIKRVSGDTKKSEESCDTFSWYAEQLGISLVTAKRKGKEKLRELLEEKNASISKEILASMKKIDGLASSFEEFNPTLSLDKVISADNITQLGMGVLYRSLKELELIIGGGVLKDPYQSSYVLINAAKLILGHKY